MLSRWPVVCTSSGWLLVQRSAQNSKAVRSTSAHRDPNSRPTSVLHRTNRDTRRFDLRLNNNHLSKFLFLSLSETNYWSWPEQKHQYTQAPPFAGAVEPVVADECVSEEWVRVQVWVREWVCIDWCVGIFEAMCTHPLGQKRTEVEHRGWNPYDWEYANVKAAPNTVLLPSAPAA